MSEENVDLSTLDRGDSLEPVVVVPDTAAAEQGEADAAKLAEDLGKAEPAKEEPEQPRDETGKFTKKDKDEDGKHIGIPKTVFDERINAERAARLAAEQRLNELQAKIDQAAHSIDASQLEADIIAKEALHTKYLMEGESEKAAQVMAEIRHAEREVRKLEDTRVRAEETAAQFQQRQIDEEKARVNEVITSLETEHPEFNEKSESFSPKLVNLVLAEQARLISEEGYSPSQALSLAAEDVLSIRGASTLAAAQETGGKGVAAERKAAAVAKNIGAAHAQPGSMKEVGIDSDKAGSTRPENEDAVKMTYEEFSALPETTKAKMRGDFI